MWRGQATCDDFDREAERPEGGSAHPRAERLEDGPARREAERPEDGPAHTIERGRQGDKGDRERR